MVLPGACSAASFFNNVPFVNGRKCNAIRPFDLPRDEVARVRGRSGWASLSLLAMAAVWGSTFFLIHDLLTRVPVLSFLAVRFAIASVVMLALAPRSISRLSPEKRWHGLILGCLYGLGQILQTWGLGHTSASVSGFITGMYVVFTPILGATLLRHRVHARSWIATGLALTGLGVLTLSGISMGAGEAVTLLAAVLYALHIVGLGGWSTPSDAIGMSVIQILVITVICSVAAIPEGFKLPYRTDDWLAVIYMAVIAGALALLAQTWAQAHLAATRSAIIMSMEPVFAAAFAVVFGGETPTARLVIGGLLVVAAMQLAES
jgi:drug/metabolite transporter (DMT)-like permease